MFTLDLDVREFTKLQNAFTVQTQEKILARVGRRIGAYLESQVPPYPQASGKELPLFYTRNEAFGKPTRPYKSKFKSSKQAYYVLKVLGEGGKIHYRRSGTLGKSITSSIRDLTGTSVTVAIGTNIPYAPLVIGSATQSNYHKGHWWILDNVVASAIPKALEIGQRELTRAIGELVNGQ